MLVEIDDFTGRRRPRLRGALNLQFRRWQGARGPSPPWDDGAPIRAELFSVERLEEHAHSLATAQAVTPGYVKGASLSMRLADNEAVLLAAYRDVAKAVDTGRPSSIATDGWTFPMEHPFRHEVVRGASRGFSAGARDRARISARRG
jgi:hypothetical protein